eukprot:jgi/Picsp_1/1641/NSC_05115-R1_telomerase activating protein est1
MEGKGGLAAHVEQFQQIDKRLRSAQKENGVFCAEAREARDDLLKCSVTCLTWSSSGASRSEPEKDDIEDAGDSSNISSAEEMHLKLGIERSVWKYGFYLPLLDLRAKEKKCIAEEEFRHLLEKTRFILDGFIQEGVLWYTRLVDELQGKETRQNNTGALDDLYAQSKLLGRCYICIGDLQRYKRSVGVGQGATCNIQDFADSRDAYLRSITASPGVGNAYNQMAVLYTMIEDDVRAIYFYLLAMSVREPFGSAGSNLQALLHTRMLSTTGNSKATMSASRDPPVKMMNQVRTFDQVERAVGDRYVYMIGALYTRVGVEKIPEILEQNGRDLEEYLNRSLQRMKKIVSSSTPRFGRSRSAGLVEDALAVHASDEFKIPGMLMMIASCLLVMLDNKLKPNSSSDSRQTVSKAYAQCIVIDLAGRLARCVARAQALVKKKAFGNKGLEAIAAEMLLPLMLLLSWVHQDIQTWKHISYLNIEQICRLSGSNKRVVNNIFKVFFQGLESVSSILGSLVKKLNRDSKYQSYYFLSNIYAVRGCSALEALCRQAISRTGSPTEPGTTQELGANGDTRARLGARRKVNGVYYETCSIIHTIYSLLSSLSADFDREECSALTQHQPLINAFRATIVSQEEQYMYGPTPMDAVSKDEDLCRLFQDEEAAILPRQSSRKAPGPRAATYANATGSLALPEQQGYTPEHGRFLSRVTLCDDNVVQEFSHDNQQLNTDQIGPSFDLDQFGNAKQNQYDILGHKVDKLWECMHPGV